MTATSARTALPRHRTALRTTALALVTALALGACGDSGRLSGSTATASAASDGGTPPVAMNPIAELDPEVWNVTDYDGILGVAMIGGTDTPLQWEADGVDDETLQATREELARFVSGAFFKPDKYRKTDDAGDLAELITVVPSVWTDGVREQWADGQRRFWVMELAPEYRVIGTPRANIGWYRDDTTDVHRILLGGTIAYGVIDTRTGETGMVAVQVGITATPATTTNGTTPTEAVGTSVLSGVDWCATDEAGGLIVPAIGPSQEATDAQRMLGAAVIAKPEVNAYSVLHDRTGPLAGNTDTNVYCD